MADPLHQVAVAGDHPGAVIHQVAEAGVEVALGDSHAHGGGQALAERAGGGLDARRVAVLGMAGRVGAELAEVPKLPEAHRLEAREMQQRIEQHGAVAGRQHEPVAVRPVRGLGIVLEEPGPKHGGDVRHAHGHACVSGLGGFDGVHGQDADGVGHGLGRGGHGRVNSSGTECGGFGHARAAGSSNRGPIAPIRFSPAAGRAIEG